MKKIIQRSFTALIMLVLLITMISPIKAANQIIIHYKRIDGNYEGWNLWVWADGKDGKEVEFNSEDDYGKIATIDLETVGKTGFIVKKVDGDNIWSAKDVDSDRFIDQFNDQGVSEVWLMEGDPEVSYTKLDGTIQDKFKDVQITDMKIIKFSTSTPFTTQELDKISVDGYSIDKIVQGTNTSAFIYLNQDIDLRKEVNVTFDRYGTSVARLGSVLHSNSFNQKYAYEGNLGYSYSKEKTEFNLWAPTALSVKLIVENEPYDMTLLDKGVWNTTITKDLHLKKYVYELEFLNNEKVISVDPYSFAVTANSTHTVIVTNEDLSPHNWDSSKRMDSFTKNTDAIIYEAHIRDLTIGKDNGIINKGKFLGLTEKGTKTTNGNLSGLDYIKSLGVTHVQFLPIYDFASIDETADLSYGKVYNWGYDPLNYNVPEGTYSTDPTSPTLRAVELKELINTLHNEGLYVIMDVVYNHVSDVNRSAFHKTVPGYFFRYDDAGRLLNGTGVGNETASEQPMFRRYMIESLKYWATEYNIDGFRFDLMGIHDVQTMKQIKEALNTIDESIILLGEGWDMGTQPSNVKANQKNADDLPGIAYFNDSIRDAIKGSVFDAADPGMVNGKLSQESLVGNNLLGANHIDKMLGNYVSAAQVVQYVEAHDNLTLFDKLLASKPDDSDAIREKCHNLATSMVLLSHGMPFIHAGQEILRTKNGDHNSYISPDSINEFDYDRQTTYPNSLNLFKELVALRKKMPLLRLDSFEAIDAAVKNTRFENNTISYQLSDKDVTLVLLFNANQTKTTLPVTSGTYTQVFNSTTLETKTVEVKDSIELEALSAVVLQQGQAPIAQTESNTNNNQLFIMIGSAVILGLLAGVIWFNLKNGKKQ